MNEEVKYPCWQCDQLFSHKENLLNTKGDYEGVKYPCGQCGQQISQKGIYVKESNILVGYAANNFLRIEILLNTKGQ